MSSETVTIWTCSRCGSYERLPERNQPGEWRQLRVAHPPNNADLSRRVDLCWQCWCLLDRFLRGNAVDAIDREKYPRAAYRPFEVAS